MLASRNPEDCLISIQMRSLDLIPVAVTLFAPYLRIWVDAPVGQSKQPPINCTANPLTLFQARQP
jgi:hypothetical protein